MRHERLGIAIVYVENEGLEEVHIVIGIKKNDSGVVRQYLAQSWAAVDGSQIGENSIILLRKRTGIV